jgi:hypothetical protein
MNKPFKDIVENETFAFNGIEYVKIPTVKISCCRSVNAKAKDNENNRVYIQPSQEVEVNDQL